MAFKSKITKQIQEKLDKKKEPKEMKNNIKTIAKYVLTVTITLAVVALGYWIYQQGVRAGIQEHKNLTETIRSEVAQSKTNENR